MFRIICVTNRKLCAGDFIARLSEISRGGADYVILREKDLSEAGYAELAERALGACGERLVLHGTGALPLLRRLPRLHLPLAVLENNPALRREAALLGVSVHSPEEAKRAEALGADYATAGHVFATDCKRGLPGRGLDFLKETAASVRTGANSDAASIRTASTLIFFVMLSTILSDSRFRELYIHFAL